MLKKTIKYTDYNGVERNEDFFFNLTKAEIMEMQMGTTGGFAEMLTKIMKTQDVPKIMEIFKKIILKAYGEKSDDGKRFIKTREDGSHLSTEFAQTEAFSNLYVELATDSKAAAAFVNGVIPSDIEVDEAKQKEFEKEIFGETLDKKETVESIETKSE